MLRNRRDALYRITAELVNQMFSDRARELGVAFRPIYEQIEQVGIEAVISLGKSSLKLVDGQWELRLSIPGTPIRSSYQMASLGLTYFLNLQAILRLERAYSEESNDRD